MPLDSSRDQDARTAPCAPSFCEAEASDEPDEYEDDLAPARGLYLGLLLGGMSLSTCAILLWWAFA